MPGAGPHPSPNPTGLPGCRQGAADSPAFRIPPVPHRSHPRRYWLYSMHAVREALANPAREIHRLLRAPARRDLPPRGIRVEIVETPQIRRLIEPKAAHQGSAAEVSPLEAETGEILDRFLADGGSSTALLLDPVSDPRNVGAVLRSA